RRARRHYRRRQGGARGASEQSFRQASGACPFSSTSEAPPAQGESAMSDDEMGNDLGKGLHALTQVLEGLVALQGAATSVVQKAKRVFGYRSYTLTIARIVAIGIGGAVVAVNQGLRAAAANVPTGATAAEPASPAVPHLPPCRTHGEVPWKGTIMC